MTDEKRKIRIDDLLKIKNVDDPQISPDSQWIAYVLRTPQTSKKGYDTHIYLVATDGSSEPFQLTRSGKDSSPRWSPDSKTLAFVSARDGKPQIYVLRVDRPGEPRPLTSNINGASSPVWSPDGSKIAYLSRMNAEEREKEDSGEEVELPKDELEGKHRQERKEEDEKQKYDPRWMERIPYRQGTSYIDDRFAQIYVISTADGLEGDDAKPTRITDKDADYSTPQWSPSGEVIFTTRAYNLDADDNYYYTNIYSIELDGAIERRFVDEDYTTFSVQVSPNGDYLAVMRRKPMPVSGLAQLDLMPLNGGKIVTISEGLDRQITGYEWTKDNHLTISIQTQAHMEIHHVNIETGEHTPLVTDDAQSIWGWSIADDGTIAFVNRTATQLPELNVRSATGDITQLTSVNQAFLDSVHVAETHPIEYENSNGDTIQGWYILPPDYEDGKQYPLALNIHGGPFVMWATSQPSMWHEWQTHAAEGYICFSCNPRGSDGYGEAWRTSIQSNWGDLAMEDILTGVQHLIDKGMIDTSRMAITGGSYGGYMTTWIIGHKPDMFHAAVTQRGVYNLNSFYGTSDVPVLIESEFDTKPWQDFEKLHKHSPLSYAHLVKTPTLIIHAENDFRVPIEQAEQYFATVRRATDTPVKMVRFPREGHELSRNGEPQHRIERLQAMVDWFNQYCKADGDDVSEDEDNIIVEAGD